MSSSPACLDPVILPLIIGETVLDAGCGFGRWGSLIATNYWEAGMNLPPVAIDGFDGFLENIEFCKKHNFYNNLWHQIMPSPLSGRWDTVLAVEFIEHLEDKHVLEAIDILEGAAKKRIILSTPSLPSLRPGIHTAIGYNQLEAHLSYRSANFFKKRGYKLIGAGAVGLRNALPQIIKKLILSPEEVFSFFLRPSLLLGASLVAYKDIK